MTEPTDLGALNAADDGAFTSALAPLFEGAPGFLARLRSERPFADWPALFERARAVAHAMSHREQVELIDAHPRLGAPPSSMSAMSVREQGLGGGGTAAVDAAAAAAVDSEHGRVASELKWLNTAYENRFGFRYCVHVAGRTRAELLPDMEASLRADAEAERHRAIDAVVDIAIARQSASPATTT